MSLTNVNFITIQAKVFPHSKNNAVEKIILEEKNKLSLKVRTTAKAVENKANEAVIIILAEHFSVRKADVEIIQGHHARQKVIRVYNATIKLAQPLLNLC